MRRSSKKAEREANVLMNKGAFIEEGY